MDNNGNKLTWTIIIIAALTIIGCFIVNNFTTLATGDSYSMQAYVKDTEASLSSDPVLTITNDQISNDGNFNAKVISNYYGWYSLAIYGTVKRHWWHVSKRSLHLAVAKLDTSDVTEGSTVKLKSNIVGAGLISKDNDTNTYTYSITVPPTVGENVKNENNSDNYYLLLWWGSTESTTNEIKSVVAAKLIAVPTDKNWGGITGHTVTLNTNGFSLDK